MSGKRITSLDTFLTAINERFDQSGKEECKRYVKETVIKCYDLCCVGGRGVGIERNQIYATEFKKGI